MGVAGLSFAVPAILLALVALPLLWWLLRAVPQAPQRLRFPGLFFLKQIRNREETPSRTPWPLLMLRLLALAALIVGLAGPRLNAPEEAGSDAPVLVVLDDGWPAADGWPRRRTALEQIAAEMADTDRQIFVLTTAPRTESRREDALAGPMTPEDLTRYATSAAPRPFVSDRASWITSLRELDERVDGTFDIRWLSDNVYEGTDVPQRRFASELSRLGNVTVYLDTENRLQTLSAIAYRADRMEATVSLLRATDTETSGLLNVTARDGRLLQETPFTIAAGETMAQVEIDLPLTLRNEIGAVRIATERSAGAVQLADASARRSLVGLAGSGDQLEGTLLDGGYYIRQALAPYALFTEGGVGELAASNATVIILDDIGRLREGDAAALRRWVAAGGVLIRFAGPTLADAAQDASALDNGGLLPVPLRGGGRAFGGALTWEEPQSLGGFDEDSPFADISLDPEINVRRQILARPGADTAERSWAYLEDGTPLVTARPEGEGLVVLFHVTTSPSWSDLPVSGLFVEMLRRLSTLSMTETGIDPDQTFAPWRVLDGYGTLGEPPDEMEPITAADAAEPAGPAMPPGLYGSPDAPLAVNAVTPRTRLGALGPVGAYDGARLRVYETRQPVSLARWFITAAIILILIEALYTLALQNKLLPMARRAAMLALMLGAGALTLGLQNEALAQQDRQAINETTLESALTTRFAYVITGDREIDTLSRAGLQGLSYELSRRTALEPGEPVGISLERDELSVFPMLYWPITAETPLPPEDALARLEAFMAGGGMVIFDTRDGERLIGSVQTPEGLALRRILERLNVPPLEPLPATGHVLGRSFYLLSDLPGRSDAGPVWVEARGAVGNLNDGVTPIIIGGRDWASAWAVDQFQRPMRPMGQGGYRQREMAMRAGINMAMVALTGNYKVDQLQAETLLEQLGRERLEGREPGVGP